jgi:hypothetical protein
MSFPLLYRICALILEEDLPHCDTLLRVLIEFFRAYAGFWRSTPNWSPITVHDPGTKGDSKDSYYMVLQYHVRCFAKDSLTEDMLKGTPEGLVCQREFGPFPTLKGESFKRFREERASVVLLAFHAQNRDQNVVAGGTQTQPRPTFRVEVVHDIFTIRDPNVFQCMNWKERGFSVDSDGTGIHVFQIIIDSVLSLWENEWTSCLDEIDESIRFPVNTLQIHVPDLYPFNLLLIKS